MLGWIWVPKTECKQRLDTWECANCGCWLIGARMAHLPMVKCAGCKIISRRAA